MSAALSMMTPGSMPGTGYGAIIDPFADGLPPQNWQEILVHHERFVRAAEGQRPWAEVAKKAIDYLEGKQWSVGDLKKLSDEGRPSLTINKIRPLIMLALGYHLNNQTDRRAVPSNDGTGTADIARMLSHVLKNDSNRNEARYVDCEVWLDGIAGGRGWWEHFIDFRENLLGETVLRAADPFSIYPDPDSTAYNPNERDRGCRYIDTSDWISVEEVREWYGAKAADRVRPLARNGITYSPLGAAGVADEELSPARTFAAIEDWPDGWRNFMEQSQNWVDTYRKTIRRVKTEHWVNTSAWFVIDLETGDKKRVPDDWDMPRLQKLSMWAKENRQPIQVQKMLTRRLRCTHIVGDTIVYDRWAMVDRFSYTPFYPYFRRGVTQGMIEPLLDVQDEINVRRSARINVIGRSSNGGWKYEKGSLTAENARKLRVEGGKPGHVLEYDRKNGTLNPPEQINPAQAPVSIEQLEKEADNDMLEIAGLNRSALGQVDQATVSGRAILARQQQAVIGLELMVSNYHRGVRLTTAAMIEIDQTYYTEQRLIRVVGVNELAPQEYIINLKTAAGIINDITVGKYDAEVGETSLLDSFLAGQFNELMELAQQGMPIPDDFLIDASSVGRKEELRIAVRQSRAAQAQQPPQPDGTQPAQPPAASSNHPKQARPPQPGSPQPQSKGPFGPQKPAA